MTRQLTLGWETGDIAEMGTTTIGTNNSLTVVNTTPTPRAGSYCLKSTITSSATWGPTFLTVSWAAAKAEVWVRFAFFLHTSGSANLAIAELRDPTPASQTALAIGQSDGLLRLYRGGVTTGTLLGTASTAMGLDSWHVIEWRTLISTTTTGTSEVWLDGNQVITLSGDNSNTATLTVQSLLLGCASAGGAVGSTGAYMAFDDLAVNDTTASTPNNARPGDGRIILLKPNGAGSSTQLARGGTDTGANYSQVNEIPPSMAQYVGSPTVAQRDLYALDNLPVAAQSINVVEVIALAQNSDAGGGSVGLTVKSGATTNEAAAIGLSTSSAYVRSRWETDPNTGAAWTGTAIDALEAGVTVR